ncbi:MAG TPA: FAD-dependent oxidoreductase [Gemmatimonadaceae bacterium]
MSETLTSPTSITYIDAADFDAQVHKGGRVIVDWYSSECPPCEALAMKFEPLAELYGADVTFIKIFRQENRALADELGVKSSPTVQFYLNGVETAPRMTGGVKRADLVTGLETLLSPRRASEIQGQAVPLESEWDLIVLGGGPAGLTSAIYAAQAKMRVVIVDTALPGGQVKTTHSVSNYPGFAKPMNGYMLAHEMHMQAEAQGVQFRAAADVTDIDLRNKKLVVDGIETLHARTMILATGASPRALGVPGEKEYAGRGISYCATCDAKYYEGKEVIVIGGGNSAVEESLFITKFASHLTMVHQMEELTANKVAAEHAKAAPKISIRYLAEPRAFKRLENGRMAVEIEDVKTHERSILEADGVFVFVGMVPNTDGFGHELLKDAWGYIKTDEDMRTSLRDVYAVGDLRSKRIRQLTTAVGDGTIAAVVISQ